MRSGEGGGVVSESGESSQIVNSSSPLLQHITGALQQSGAPTPPQRQVLFSVSSLNSFGQFLDHHH